MSFLSDPLTDRAMKRVGTVLRQKWRLDRLMGVGGMAAVYAGTHRNGSRGAIKMLHRELSVDAELRERFLREGYVANAVEHPSVVKVLDDDVAEDGSVFIVMELLDGETVDRRAERSSGVLPVDEVLCIFDPVLAVLEVAHARGVIHRDVKPENLFICNDGSVKLLDFGIARLRETASKLTQTGSALGTPAFMAPEQALGDSNRIGPPTDIFAVGTSMYFLLTGRYAHPGETPNAQLISAATRQVESLAHLRGDLPPRVITLVDTALAFDPRQRWQSARAMQEGVRKAYHAAMGSPVETAPKLTVPQAPAPAVLAEASRQAQVVPQTPPRQPARSLADDDEEDVTRVAQPGPVLAAAMQARAAAQAEPSRAMPVARTVSDPGLTARPSWVTGPQPAAPPPAHRTDTASPSAVTARQGAAPSRAFIMGAAAGVVVLGALFIGIILIARPDNSQGSTEVTGTTPSASATTASSAPTPPPASASAASATPAQPSIDSLPSVGVVKVTSKGGQCEVSLDGVAKGKTPIEIDAPPGDHKVACKLPSGQVLTQTAKVKVGETGSVTFVIPRSVDYRDKRR